MGTSTVDIKANSANDQKVNQADDAKTAVHVTDLIVARVRYRCMLRIAWLRKLWKDDGNKNGLAANYHIQISPSSQ